ncbi:MAG: thioredoxin family protein [Planctomycetes bacterium]|nr:thioredoxin family protein [Planctomycetota bacterium]
MNENTSLKRWLCASLLCVLFAGGGIWAEGAVWLESYDQAKLQAAEQGKDLLVLFTGSDWCSWCKKLEAEVLNQDGFDDKVPSDFVLVKLDFPRNRELAAPIKAQNDKLRAEFKANHGFRGYPTVYLTDAKGVPYAKTGYQAGGPEKYLEHLAFLKEAKPLVDVKDLWLENYAVAKAKAAAQKKDLLINFTGSDWCIWCVRLEKGVFSKAFFKTHAPEDFVFAKIDFPQKKKQSKELVSQNKGLQSEFSTKYGDDFKFRGFPTVYVADSSGKPYGITGYKDLSPDKYVKHLIEMKHEHQKKQKKQ